MQRLILGCGPRHERQEGDVTLDIRKFDCVDVIHDLNRVPWPFQDAEFIHASAVHVVEHLRSLLTFMNESWRVLAVGGDLYIETPLAGGDSDLEWADPTHVRCYRPHTFINYFTPAGVEQFGYTNRAWAILHLAVRDNCVIFHGSPIKR